jgi:hypothetical protein
MFYFVVQKGCNSQNFLNLLFSQGSLSQEQSGVFKLAAPSQGTPPYLKKDVKIVAKKFGEYQPRSLVLVFVTRGQ